jgi:hypothetical protein
MKRTLAVLAAVIIVLLLSGNTAFGTSLGVSPSSIEVEVPAEGTATVSFQVHYFSGDIQVSLVDIPLKVEPETLHVDSSSKPTDVKLTLYGDESLGSKIYKGYIRFLGTSGGMVGVAVRAKATVTNLVAGETPVLAPPEPPQSSSPAQPEAASPSPASEQSEPQSQGVTILPSPEGQASEEPTTPLLPPSPEGGSSELPILPIVGIAAGALIVITLIIVIARRPRY